LPVASFDEGALRAKGDICEETRRVCVGLYGESLRAVVLTGSLARDEATFVKEGAHWRLLGDADFFLVFHDGARQPSHLSADPIGPAIEDVLYGKGLIASIGLSPVDSSYLCTLTRCIAAYELRTCGRVIWGDRAILSLVPEFKTAEILLEDAWRLLANRMIEQLEAVASADQTSDVLSQDAHYCTVKLYLDMATSYLAFAGRYLPTYREREQVLRHLAADASSHSDVPFPLRPFSQRVSECTRFKLEGRGLAGPPRELWEDAVGFAQMLWTWELKRLNEMSKSSDSKLMVGWMDEQPVEAKIRGWASVVRRSGWLRSWRQWPRWIRLCRQASPRYWVYNVATEIFFRLPSLMGHSRSHWEYDPDWKSLTFLLPLPHLADSEPGPLTWQHVARLTALNYHRFLKSTTA